MKVTFSLYVGEIEIRSRTLVVQALRTFAKDGETSYLGQPPT
jgi:hypothetical protein